MPTPPVPTSPLAPRPRPPAPLRAAPRRPTALARTSPPPGQRPPARRRQPPQIARALLALLAVLAALGLALHLLSQSELIAWLVVGAILAVVFGTPLLCLAGLVALYVWALARSGRRRAPVPQPSPPAPALVGEVVFDD